MTQPFDMGSTETLTESRTGTEQRPGSRDFGVPLPRPMPKTLHWSVPWSDLMMTMFILFAVLYFYQTNSHHAASRKGENFTLKPTARSSMQAPLKSEGSLQQDSTASIAGTANESMSSLYDFTKKTVEAKDMKDFASVDLVADKAVRIILAGDLLFDTGRAEIKTEAKASLRHVADIIRTTPYMVNVVGHTDDVPIHTEEFPTNWELSVTRASRVARFLIEEMHLPGERFFVTGHAFYQPVRPNSSIRNRAANRRVEIIITKDRPQGIRQGAEEPASSPGRAIGAFSQYDRWPWNTF